ncbi:MAG: hypothetical protein ERJ68_00105 [Aphanocapsa feldmannii 277cI]|uniref:Uncharacterized protein n=1 Tax=Aphanocapsa feldmannii 277cI TaxID=2507554 RepID=A0A524RVZ3_9CHRO|nr:MAG: hypothetical protein ERJ68_00105 [Aphanocapsa feldmannii 277cI]
MIESERDWAGRFTVRDGDQIVTVTRLRDLPPSFDVLVAFVPHIPPPPHTPEQHAAIAALHTLLRQLQARERHGRRHAHR